MKERKKSMAFRFNMRGLVYQVWEQKDGLTIPDEYVFRHYEDAKKRKEELEQLTKKVYKITSASFITEIEETDEYEW